MEKKVLEEDLAVYIEEGFKLGQLDSHKNKGSRNGMYGRTHTDEVKERLRIANEGSNNPAYRKEWYNNGVVTIRCHSNDERVLSGGFTEGHLYTDEHARSKISESMKNTIFVHNEDKTIRRK